MSVLGRRYARAAVDAAKESGHDQAIDELAEGLRAVHAAFEESEELRELLLNPVFMRDRDEVLASVLGELKVSEETQGLVRLLAEKDRIDILGDVATEVETIADEQAGRIRAFVTSAIPLEASQVKRVSQALQKRFGGKGVVVSTSVDPELLGGFVCRVGDLTMDSSVRHQLNRLGEQLQRRAS